MPVERMNREELSKYKGSLTVGKLKELLNEYELSDDALVLVERVEDTYFENHHWKVYPIRSWHCANMIRYNESLAAGEFDDVPEEDRRAPFTEEELDSMDSQYHPAHWASTRKEHPDLLFISMHY